MDKYSLKKFKMSRTSISPFVDMGNLHHELVQQKYNFAKKLKVLEKNDDFFNMIFKEIDEDESD